MVRLTAPAFGRVSARLAGALLALAAVAAVAPTVAAQQPLPIGTATALGLGGMTEARFGEAALWNPALLGLFDGPRRSYSVPSAVGETSDFLQTWRWWRQMKLLRDLTKPVIVRGSTADIFTNPLLRGGDRATTQMRWAVQWVAAQNDGVAVSLTTSAYWALEVPRRAAEIMTGDAQAVLRGPTATDLEIAARTPTRQWMATTLAIAKARDLGVQPVLGRTWIGSTLTASTLTHNTLGRFLFGPASQYGLDSASALPLDPTAPIRDNTFGAQYRTLELNHSKLFALSVGTVFAPLPPLLVSVTAANIVQRGLVSRSPQDLSQTTFSAAGVDSVGQTRLFMRRQTLNPADTLRPWLGDANLIADGTRWAPTLRVATSVDLAVGRVLAGWASRFGTAPALDEADGDRWSVGWMLPRSDWRPRVAVSQRFDGSRAWSAGLQTGFCTTRAAWGLALIDRPRLGRTVEVSLSWSRGEGPCGLVR